MQQHVLLIMPIYILMRKLSSKRFSNLPKVRELVTALELGSSSASLTPGPTLRISTWLTIIL